MSQSHHSGIESMVVLGSMLVRSGRNRTIVGLKGNSDAHASSRMMKSQSHHSGIESMVVLGSMLVRSVEVAIAP